MPEFARATRAVKTDATRSTGPGRNRNGRFGMRTGNKQTFVHGDCQRQPAGAAGVKVRPGGSTQQEKWGNLPTLHRVRLD